VPTPCRGGSRTSCSPRTAPGLTASGQLGGPGGHDVGSNDMGSVIKKRRKRMAKKKHRKLLKKTRVQRRNKK
jgi:hypothetical protein